MKVGVYIYIKKYFTNFNCRILPVTILFLFLMLHQASGNVADQKVIDSSISLKLASASIPDVLSALETKAGCVINYNRSLFKQNNLISIDVKNMRLEQVISKILANTRVGFKFADPHTILLYRLPDLVKPGKISGRVTDDKGETLPGASLRVIETGTGIQTGVDGSYILSLPPGTYTLEVTYISFQTRRITGIIVTEDKNTPLDIALKPEEKGLKEVVVTASYRKASVEGLLVRQKNAAELSNGISAEQIARTPDKNIGESLKRISGVSSIDNKFVLVRGIGERYNSATLDGTVLPSTEAQTRNFSFDLIPSNLVDNVVVSKTVTPDMNVSFGGGLIQINTKDIPSENFMSFAIGASYNDQSTGKDFLSHKRGKYDYLGFDDGRRDFPEGLVHTDRTTAPNIDLSQEEFEKKVVDQSRKFKNDNFTIYKYKTAPSQNYQFTIGRLLALDTTNNNKLGFTGSLSYRNTQQINVFDQQKRSDWSDETNNYGASYGFNTTWGALFNVGLQLGKNRFSLRNTYTHLYDNALVRTIGYDDIATDFIAKKIPNRIEETDDPTFTNLLQNKLNGQHQLGKVKIEWDLARTGVNRQEKDYSIATQGPTLIGNDYEYFYGVRKFPETNILPTSRQNYRNKEQHYSWDVSATVPLIIAGIRNSVKTGYFGNRKSGDFKWQIATLANLGVLPDSLRYIPIGDMIKQENIKVNGYSYLISQFFLDAYKGKSETHAGYLMLDSRLLEKLRLVWGVRADYYKYTEIQNGNNILIKVFSLKKDPRWQWLPSANLTYSPTAQINIRGAFSSTVVRPELLDNSQFWRYSPYFGAQFGNQGLYSTRINSYDIKTEWFPGLGEIISLGGFYKKFDRPVELTFNNTSGNIVYYLKSSDDAKVYGLEFELRKSLSFIADNKVFSNITAYGNLTLQKSDVRSTFLAPNPADTGKTTINATVKQKRPMYGQSPYLINAGLQYSGEHLGLNVAYNKSGYKTYVVSDNPTLIEYERPREQLDAQISYRLLKRRMEIRFNFGNLLNGASSFYQNIGSYELNPDRVVDGDDSDTYRLKPGFTRGFEKGDVIRFSQKFGRTYSTSIAYNF